MAFGLGNFLYEVSFDGKTANFNFWDPEDTSNTAQVSVPQKDIPAGQSADSRDVAEHAYNQVSKDLNGKRDSRLIKEREETVTTQQTAEARARAETEDYLKSAQENVTEPAAIETDENGNEIRIYNAAPPSDKKAKK